MQEHKIGNAHMAKQATTEATDRSDAAVGPDGSFGGRNGRGRKNRSRGWNIVFWIAVAVFVCALIALGIIGWSYWSASNRYSEIADQDTFDAHRYIYFLTPEKNYKLKTFSLVRTTGTDPLAISGFSSAQEMAKYVKDKEDNSLVTPSEGFPKPSSVKHIFTFATCDYNEENGRAVLFSYVAKTAVPHDDASDTVGKYVAATE